MKKIAKLLSLSMGFVLAMSVSAMAMAAQTQDNKIVIYATNDVHCEIGQEIDDKSGEVEAMGYAAVADLVKTAESIYMPENVTLVDAGDAIQGGPVGTLSDGQYIVDLMNATGYDIVTFGNHEFDYGMDELMTQLVPSADYEYTCSNFVKVSNGDSVVDAYEMVNYGTVDVAYVGVTTPETFTKSNPANFQNSKGKYIYSFCEGNDGQDLYDNVQDTIDDAKKAGAEYVVVLGHLGVDEESSPWTSKELIANTTGIDIFIDGHSHSTLNEFAIDEAGKEVRLVQSGTKLSSVNKIVIDKATGEIAVEEVKNYLGQDAEVAALVQKINGELAETLQEVVANTSVDLTTKAADGETRAIRNSETNLGDLVTDAYRVMMGADVAVTNGGGVRADIEAGDITYEEIIKVHPFGNEISLIEVTGEQIMQALEMGVKDFPGESGGFMQISGATYTIDPSVASPVKTNEFGEFVALEGANRVVDVKIAGEPIDLAKTYTLASHNYMLKNGGDGFVMFKDCKIVKDSSYIDNQILIDYIIDELGGVVGEEYANIAGQGRISVVEPAKWYDEAIKFAQDNKLIYETEIGTDNPLANADRATVFNALYIYEGSPEVDDCTFTDINEENIYYEAAAWAEETGLSNGDGDGTFQPARAITREEVAAIFVRYNAYKGYIFDEVALTNNFSDAKTISPWAGEYVADAVRQGVMQGNADSTFAPLGNLNIAELSTMMMNLEDIDPLCVEKILYLTVPATKTVPEHIMPAIVCSPYEDGEYPGVVMLSGTGTDKNGAGIGGQVAGRELAGEGMVSMRFDFMGNGESTMSSRYYDYSSAEADSMFALEYLADLENCTGNVGLIGWSQGGTIATYTAGNNDEVGAIVLWETSTELGKNLLQEGDYEEAEKNGFFVMEYSWRDAQEISLQWCKDALNIDVVDVFSKSKAPVLAIYGDIDDVVPQSASEDTVAASKNPASKMVILKNVDHTLQVFNPADNFETIKGIAAMSADFLKAELK